MALVQAAPFTFRDFMQQILPGLIAAGLFVPYTGTEQTEATFIGAALLSYVIYTPVSKAANVFKVLPFLRKKIRKLDADRVWMGANWNYDRLFYVVTNEEREYLYLTGAYMQFYKLSAFYFFLYALTQLFALGRALWGQPSASWMTIALAQTTPILGGKVLPLLPVLGASCVIFWYLVQDYLNEYYILIFQQYPEFARKYHMREGGIVESVWGTVSREEGSPVVGATVVLESGGGRQERSRTDAEGRFQFQGVYAACTAGPSAVLVQTDGTRSVQRLPAGDRWTPPVTIIVRPAGASAEPLPSEVGPASAKGASPAKSR